MLLSSHQHAVVFTGRCVKALTRPDSKSTSLQRANQNQTCSDAPAINCPEMDSWVHDTHTSPRTAIEVTKVMGLLCVNSHCLLSVLQQRPHKARPSPFSAISGMCTCVSVCACVCLGVCMAMCDCVSVCTHVSAYLCPCLYLCICLLCLCSCVHTCICVSVCTHVCLRVSTVLEDQEPQPHRLRTGFEDEAGPHVPARRLCRRAGDPAPRPRLPGRSAKQRRGAAGGGQASGRVAPRKATGFCKRLLLTARVSLPLQLSNREKPGRDIKMQLFFTRGTFHTTRASPVELTLLCC